ncbi:MAG: glycine--tRNA ligase [Planctomycetes bacterium]|nr:glycine--tRNA ligase [Planctomycetota bacterium]
MSSDKKEKKAKGPASEEQIFMEKIVSLCKRRGFVFPSSEIYGGLKSCYDYGPLGVELKRNVKNEWWRAMVHSREDVVGIDASIIMSPEVWRASGHLSSFSDPLVDCRDCKVRGRADHWPKADPGSEVEYKVVVDHQSGKKETRKSKVSELGIVCPECGSPNHSDIRSFNLMFRTSIGSVDPIDAIVKRIEGKGLSGKELKQAVVEAVEETAVYLRPETAQAMFVNFANVQGAARIKPPFGIAQQGKSFRNEVTVEHFTYRSCEFEQMEMEFFVPPKEHCEPGERTPNEWFEYWCQQRHDWYAKLGIRKEKLRLRPHAKDELAHYAKENGACQDVEYEYPWGWGELEGIANRTDYDLKAHEQASGKKLSYFDPQRNVHYHPYVIEPAAGADRAALAFLLDAYTEEAPSETRKDGRVLLKLHPRLAPIKVAVLPLVKKDGMPERARKVMDAFVSQSINAFYDEKDAVGRRYARQDEAGTPYCLTVDGQTSEDGTVTIRERDSMKQDRIKVEEAVAVVQRRLAE